METEWRDWCDYGSVLYFCTHGSTDQIWLRDGQVVGLLTLKEWIYNAEKCHVHFGGCDTFSGGEDNLNNLMGYTEATSVSGYATDVRWLGPNAPALALELLFFGLLSDVKLEWNSQARPEKLGEITKEVDRRFSECKFKMLVRSYDRS